MKTASKATWDNRGPTPSKYFRDVVELRDQGFVNVIPREWFEAERAEGRLSERAVWRKYGEERFRRLHDDRPTED